MESLGVLNQMSKHHQGSCLCKRVKYEIRGELTSISFCHCSMCRKISGAASAAVAIAAPDHLFWIQGEELLKKFQFETGWSSTFCFNCGSPLPQCHNTEPMCFIPAGSLDTDPGPAVMGHIFVGSKAAWDQIASDAPQFDKNYV